MGNSSSSEIKELFKKTDTDGNGVLDIDEFRTLLSEQFQELRSFAKIIFKLYSSKKDAITFKDFVCFIKDSKIRNKTNKSYIGRKIFNFIDSDHSGMISREEYESVINDLEFPSGMQRGNNEINSNEEMSYEQFLVAIMQVFGSIWSVVSEEDDGCDVE